MEWLAKKKKWNGRCTSYKNWNANNNKAERFMYVCIIITIIRNTTLNEFKNREIIANTRRACMSKGKTKRKDVKMSLLIPYQYQFDALYGYFWYL